MPVQTWDTCFSRCPWQNTNCWPPLTKDVSKYIRKWNVRMTKRISFEWRTHQSTRQCMKKYVRNGLRKGWTCISTSPLVEKRMGWTNGDVHYYVINCGPGGGGCLVCVFAVSRPKSIRSTRRATTSTREVISLGSTQQLCRAIPVWPESATRNLDLLPKNAIHTQHKDPCATPFGIAGPEY